MTETYIVTQTEFARACGVRVQSVSKAMNYSLKDAVVGRKINAWHPEAIRYHQRQAERKGVKFQFMTKTKPKQKHRMKVEEDRRRRAAAKRPLTPSPDSDSVDIPLGLKGADGSIGDADGSEVAGAPGQTVHPHDSESQRSFSKGMDSLPPDIRALADMTLRELVNIFGTDDSFLSWLRATKEIENIHEKRLKNMKMEGTLVDRELVRKGVLDVVDAAHKQMLTDGARTVGHEIHAMSQAGEPVEACEAYVSKYLTGFIKPMKRKVKRSLKW